MKKIITSLAIFGLFTGAANAAMTDFPQPHTGADAQAWFTQNAGEIWNTLLGSSSVDLNGMATEAWVDANYASKSYVDAKKAEANSYTDNKLLEAQSYADAKKVEANSYTDNKLLEAQSYADAKKTEANSYTDNKLLEAQSYADAKKTEANSYTDGKVEVLAADKADKAIPATAGNLAGLDATGNLMDSGFGVASIVSWDSAANGGKGAKAAPASLSTVSLYDAAYIDANYYTAGQVDAMFDELGGYMSLMGKTTDQRIDAMSDWVKDIQKELSAGIASATALTGIDNHLDKSSRYSVGIGGGHYNGQSSVAMGAVIRTSYTSALNFGLAIDTYQAKPAMRVGWNIQW